jgi:4-carboxymuconolactone decarboxylase
MRFSRTLLGFVLPVGIFMATALGLSGRYALRTANAGAMPPQGSAASFPKDVYADTGSRLPAIKREDLDDAGKKLFDSKTPPDAFGPGAIRLYSLPVAEHMAEVNSYLRNKSGLDQRLIQMVILVTARESDSEYVWTAHEPQGLKAGLQPEIIDVIRYRKPLNGLAEKDAVIIDLGRQVFEKHHVSSATADRALELYGKQGLVNIVSLMGDYAATTVLLNAFDQHIRPTDKPLLPIPKK